MPALTGMTISFLPRFSKNDGIKQNFATNYGNFGWTTCFDLLGV